VQLALQTIVAQGLARQRVPGVVVGVWASNRGTWTYALGIGDLQTAAPVTLDDHFRIASVTKTFVATVVLQLVDEGKLSLEDTLEPFVPGILHGQEITIRQLLGMTAGIFNYVTDPAFEVAYSSNPLMSFTPKDAVEIAKRHGPNFAPGERLLYCDTNYILLGLIMEQVTGQTAGELIATRILDPLAMTNTSFPDSPDMPEPFSRGYAASPGSDTLRDLTASNPTVAWTAGAMVSTLEDLRTWARALADGSLLSPATQQARLQTKSLGQRQGDDFGYGLGILGVNGFYGHNGAIFGYSTWMLHSPEQDATLVVLANRGETETEFAGTIALDIAHLIFPDSFPVVPGAAAAATPTA
jgi:D-alanyl-D-alanine carboxypeptidase